VPSQRPSSGDGAAGCGEGDWARAGSERDSSRVGSGVFMCVEDTTHMEKALAR
jgi:hypothetical protein